MQNFAYSKTDIFEASNLGLDIINEYYPNSIGLETTNKHFKVRETEKTPSANLWFSKQQNCWCVKDWGGETSNAIDIVMKEDNISFADACQVLASKYNISKKTPTIFKPVKTFNNVSKDNKLKAGDYTIEYDSSVPETALKMLGVFVTQELCDKYKLKHVKSILTVFENKKTKQLTSLVKESTPNYPIFCFDHNTWQKTYEPKAPLKKDRFRFYGNKPTRFVFGLSQFQHNAEVNRTLQGDDDKAPEEIKLNNVIMVSGGSDGLNVASLNPDYNVIWYNSESEQVDYNEYQQLKDDAHNVYNLADIDETGIKQGIKLGNQFLDLKHVWLPDALKDLKDQRGNACKDAKDYINRYYRNNEPNAIKGKFDRLLKNALPFQFWDKFLVKKQYQYKFNSTHAFHFLKHQGFYKVSDDAEKQGFAFIKKTDNKVKRVTAIEIKDYVNNFLANKNSPVALRNVIYDTAKLGEKQLAQLLEIDLDLNDASKDSQHLFFDNGSWEITANSITKIANDDCKKMVWADKIINHNVKIEEPYFKIDASNIEQCTIDILDKDCWFLNYLTNTSRVYWQKEYKDENSAYLEANKFNIKSNKLSEKEQLEQQQHLVNKIYTFGYLFHKYKSFSKSYLVYAMDNKIGELGASNGGSGKSLSFNLAVKQVYKNVQIIGGDKESLDDKFKYDGTTKETDAIIIDDAHEHFSIRPYFHVVTGDLPVNPKGFKPYVVPFSQSPKMVVTTNYEEKNLSGSYLRRLLFVSYSDYYHAKSKDYDTERKVTTDFNGVDFFSDQFPAEQYNKFYNFIAQCIQFYLTQELRINPPMDNILVRSIKRKIGDSFNDWADSYFEINPQNLNVYLERPELYQNYKEKVGKTAKNTRNFKDALMGYCEMKQYEFAPNDFVPLDSSGRRKKTGKDKNNRSVELFYIKADLTEDQKSILNTQSKIEKLSLGLEPDNDIPF